MERKQLTDEHIDLWRRGCAELEAMTPREWEEGEGERYDRFLDINKRLT